MNVSLTDRIVITGGAGFLGQVVAEQLTARGYGNLLIPRRKDFELTHEADAQRLYTEFRPNVVMHLAAEVGGIGANRDNPGRFFFANLAMGMHLMEQARINKIKKFIQIGSICAYPKYTPVPF